MASAASAAPAALPTPQLVYNGANPPLVAACALLMSNTKVKFVQDPAVGAPQFIVHQG